MNYRKKPQTFKHILSAPIIYSCIVILVILDIWIEIYHRICFPLYGLKYIKRSNYIKIDRHKLSYLTWYEKINCMYCGYGNGLINYISKILAKTEEYWCGIMHQEKYGFIPPNHHTEKEFVKYGDQEEMEKKYKWFDKPE